MPLRNTVEKFGSVAKFFHWFVFLLIASLLAVGFIMTDLPNDPNKFKLYGLHKSIGIAVLLLAILRFVWRMMNVTPQLPDTLRPIEKWGAHASHWLLYALIIAMPLSGWMMSSAGGFSVSVFGWFILPNLVAPNKELLETLRATHFYLAWAIIAMVVLHVLAALLHHFYYKDNVLRRMLPFTALKRE